MTKGVFLAALVVASLAASAAHSSRSVPLKIGISLPEPQGVCGIRPNCWLLQSGPR